MALQLGDKSVFECVSDGWSVHYFQGISLQLLSKGSVTRPVEHREQTKDYRYAANNSFICFNSLGTAVHGSSFDSYSRAT